MGSRTHTAIIYSVVGTFSSATERPADEAAHSFQYRNTIKYIRSYHSIPHTSEWCEVELSTRKIQHFTWLSYMLSNVVSKWHKGIVKVKVIPQQAEVDQGVPGRLRSRIFLTFGTTRVAGRQTYVPAAVTLGEIPGTHFKWLSRPQGPRFRRGELRKKFPVTHRESIPGSSD